MLADKPTPSQADNKHPKPRPKFQYSLKTLLWVMTVCAVLSAIAGWIGPKWSIAFLVGLPHVALWGIPMAWFALHMLKTMPETDPTSQAIYAVVWSALLGSVTVSGPIVGSLLCFSPRTYVTQGLIEFEISFIFVLFGIGIFFLLMTWVIFALTCWCQLKGKALARLLGAIVGFICACPLVIAYPETKRTELLICACISLAVGLFLPLLLLKWADRLA